MEIGTLQDFFFKKGFSKSFFAQQSPGSKKLGIRAPPAPATGGMCGPGTTRPSNGRVMWAEPPPAHPSGG